MARIIHLSGQKSSGSKVYLTDRLGRYVEGFPVMSYASAQDMGECFEYATLVNIVETPRTIVHPEQLSIETHRIIVD